ncbi:MAG: DUF2939 domain-containing protein [Variibacter sp.]|nr:DUF2939 domain-containing protein [Variibacter sp.]
MRWTLRLGLAAVTLLVVYTVWPFVDLYRLARAVERRDAAALSRQVEFSAVQTSVTRQVLRTYLALTGQQERVPAAFREATLTVAAAALQPALAQLATPEKMLDFVAESWPRRDDASARTVNLFSGALSQAWALYWASDYRFRNFDVAVPPEVEPARRLGLQFFLVQWRWKLYGVVLPEEVRVRAAQELIKATAQK